MENKFKVGDKVRCVSNTGNEKNLELNKIYTVKSEGVLLIEVKEAYGVFYPSRFELVEEQNEIKQMNKKPAAFSIAVKDPIVSEFIQKLLFQKKICWGNSKAFEVQETNWPYLFVSFDTESWGRNKLYFVTGSAGIDDFEVYDAVKDLPKIMELIETPSMPLPIVNGYTMGEYKSGHTSVVFGCAHISIRLLRSILKLMQEKFTGNRQLEKITLNSGVTLGKTDVENILKYVDFVNKK